MQKIQTKTLSLRYYPQEDRMKFIINKNEENSIVFWITRRLYLSILFELDTYLESIDMDKKIPSKYRKGKKQESGKEKELISSNAEPKSHLLSNIKLNIGEKRKRFFISFYSESLECETIMTTDTFLNFYAMMKSTFPKNEWGLI